MDPPVSVPVAAAQRRAATAAAEPPEEPEPPEPEPKHYLLVTEYVIDELGEKQMVDEEVFEKLP